jgi:hypothetical protein
MFGHIDGARDGLTKVRGGESELGQGNGRYFLLEFQWRVLGASHAQQLQDSLLVLLIWEAQSPHIGEHALDSARAAVGALAAARAAAAVRAAAAEVIEATSAAAVAAATAESRAEARAEAGHMKDAMQGRGGGWRRRGGRVRARALCASCRSGWLDFDLEVQSNHLAHERWVETLFSPSASFFAPGILAPHWPLASTALYGSPFTNFFGGTERA